MADLIGTQILTLEHKSYRIITGAETCRNLHVHAETCYEEYKGYYGLKNLQITHEF